MERRLRRTFPSPPSYSQHTDDLVIDDSENLAKLNGNGSSSNLAQPVQTISTNDLYIKDAFLVFRALCKLSMKPLGAER